MKNRAFYGLLHARGESLGSLARAIGVRNHGPLSQVICGRRSGKETWPKLAGLLTAGEMKALGRDARGVVAGETKFHVEQGFSESSEKP